MGFRPPIGIFGVSEMGFRPPIGIFGVSEMSFRPPIGIFGMSEMDFNNQKNDLTYENFCRIQFIGLS